MKTIINVETGEVIERELNAEEIAQQKIDEAKVKEAIATELAIEAEKSAKKAELLAKLGITEEEAKILLS